MRVTCLDCVRKHLAAAEVNLFEAVEGYPMHVWYAVGHMQHAEEESFKEYPLFAAKIRAVRINFMSNLESASGNEEMTDILKIVDIPTLIAEACNLAYLDGEAINYLAFDPDNTKKAQYTYTITDNVTPKPRLVSNHGSIIEETPDV